MGYANACYSEEQAEAFSTHVPYVVGMNRAIKDQAAIDFSSGFYLSLAREEGDGLDLEFAFNIGKAKINLEGGGGQDIPILHKRD